MSLLLGFGRPLCQVRAKFLHLTRCVCGQVAGAPSRSPLPGGDE